MVCGSEKTMVRALLTNATLYQIYPMERPHFRQPVSITNYKPVILLATIVHVLRLTNLNTLVFISVELFDTGSIGAAFIDVD